MGEADHGPGRERPGTLVGLAVSGVATGAALGALTNAVNGRVCPEYFQAAMGWRPAQDVASMSVAQGIFEGILFGLALSLIFVVVIGVVSRGRCPYRLSAAYLMGIAGAALACWAAGGLIAMGLATLSPDFYGHAFRRVPEEAPDMLRFAWVGGSIWGLEFAGFAAVVVASVLFRARWRSLVDRDASLA